MRIVKRLSGYLLLIILVSFTGLMIWKPYLGRVLWYRTPDANTYKAFPQTIVYPGDSIFHFFRPRLRRTDLDTLQVKNGKNELIPFSEYFEKGKLNVFLVIRNDSVLYERYSPGYSDSTLTTVFSCAKSMMSVMIGQALDKGMISSIHDRVIIYIPELKINPAFQKITIKHLLDMKSGLDFQDALGGVVKAFFSDEAKFYYTHDMKAELLKVKMANEPGTVWKYESIDPLLLAWVLEKASHRSVAQFFEENTWKKIGTQYKASFGLDHISGLANTASRFQVTAIDLAKIGRLYLNKGKYNGKQVVPESWVDQSTQLGTDQPVTAKGWQRSTQKYLWWLPQEGEKGDFAAEGMLGQRLYVDPKTNTIIVQFADHGAGDYPYRKISRYLAGLPFSYPKL